ncbi:Gfo/Idh/MocA family oxidoreductase [Jiangella ureilytica]|uniref:Gfo/Idh/MocA family oxidoreductase n=1 Tax=Jiangella ureilytica TaxID=2530374 RepID=A0A4R4RLE5_9ACTN|nr:Gfo/Idh/MocA family oxidoreductase [Jiangella ureilytica]TDC50370.1 Gfo/Idh/MocA family oxidoreductase [Jiangella ureilytica]
MTLGVGFLGAGPVTQAIHLPTLARLGPLFRVVHVMDVDPAVAAEVASRVGARSTTRVGDVLEDPGVDVVAVCSPPRVHTAQVEAACRAGVRGVLCEKPLATTIADAERIEAVTAATGVPVVVGAMHTFDPAWRWARTETMSWGDVHAVRSRIVNGPNARFEDAATEFLGRPPFPRFDLDTPEAVAAFLRHVILTLAIHDLPLVRHFAPIVDEVIHVDAVEPFGWLVLARGGDTTVELTGSKNATWKPDWTFEVVSADAHLLVEFPPSYVHAGAGVAAVTTRTGTRLMPPEDHNGYEGEWRRIAELARGVRTDPRDVQAAVDDLRYAVDLAEAAAARALTGRAA